MVKRAKQKDTRSGKPKLSATQMAAKRQAELNWRKEQAAVPKKRF